MIYHGKVIIFTINNEEFRAFRKAAWLSGYTIEYCPFKDFNRVMDNWTFVKDGKGGILYEETDDSYSIKLPSDSELSNILRSL